MSQPEMEYSSGQVNREVRQENPRWPQECHGFVCLRDVASPQQNDATYPLESSSPAMKSSVEGCALLRDLAYRQ